MRLENGHLSRLFAILCRRAMMTSRRDYPHTFFALSIQCQKRTRVNIYEYMLCNSQLCKRTCVQEFCISAHVISLAHTQATLMTCTVVHCTYKTVHCTALNPHAQQGAKNPLLFDRTKHGHNRTHTDYFNKVVYRSRLHFTSIWKS